MKIKIIDFNNEYAPKRAHDNDAGADVYSPVNMRIAPGTSEAIPLGFGLEIPDGYAGFIFPRSGLASKGISCELPPVDSGYRGQIHAIMTNHTTDVYYVKKGDRVGQLVILPIVIADFVKAVKNDRGTGAFGSTGR